MEKLLLLGNANFTKDLVRVARKMGAYVIVSDSKSAEGALKELGADEYWDIAVTDLDALEKKSREVGVTSVYAGVHEVCLLKAMELSERLGLDFYTDKETWELIGDKRKFKYLCKKYEVPVAKHWDLHDDMTESEVAEMRMDFPVIVKPNDGSAGVGITVCKNAKEVLQAYDVARKFSEDIFAEKFIDGTMISLYYCFDNEGKAHLFASYDDYKMSVFNIFSAHLDMIKRDISPKLEKMFYEIGIRRGFGFVQMMCDEDENCAILEMNYRLAGAIVSEELNDLLCEIVLRDAFGLERIVPAPDVHMFDILLYAKGGRITDITGLDKVRQREDYLFEGPWKKIGDVIEDDTGLRQAVIAIFFNLTTKEKQKENIDFVLENVKIVGENGENLLLRKF